MKIFPLNPRRILKLVQKEMLVPDAYFLVHERGVGAINYVFQQNVGFLYADHVMFSHHIHEGRRKFVGDAKIVYLVLDLSGRIKRLYASVVIRYEVLHRWKQNPFQRGIFLHVSLLEPRLEVLRLTSERISEARDASVRIHAIEFFQCLGHERPRSYARIDACRKKSVLDRLHGIFQPATEILHHLSQYDLHPFQVFLGICLRVVHPIPFCHCPVLVRLKLRSHI